MNNYINTTAPTIDLNAKTIPTLQQLDYVEQEIAKLAEMQEALIRRLGWVTSPYDPAPDNICEKSEYPDSEIVYRLKRSVHNIKELQAKLGIQLEYLDI